MSAGLGVPADLLAQDTGYGGGRPHRDWDVTLGGGAAVVPTFEGSNRYRVSPVPFVNVTWNDIVTLSMDGLSAYWRHENFRIGGGLTYSSGRQQGTSLFGQSDDRLTGLGDIPAALGLRGFAEYRVGAINVNASIVKFTASGDDGVLVNLGVAAPYKLADDTTVVARAWATWADQSYMETYFGVTTAQAANSGFAKYDARAGIKDVGVDVGLNHEFDRHWAVLADVRVARLTGSAENSPIVFSKTAGAFMSVVKYHF
jgi:outer membrane scaffolding protein for murein synthesis (MipA/OmpV family)